MELTLAKLGGTGVIDTLAKMGETVHDKNGWNWCYRHRDKNEWSSLWQKWVELSMKKWVELTVAKIGGTGVKDNVT